MQITQGGSEWVRVDAWSAMAYPLVMVVGFTLLGDAVVRYGWLHGWYLSPYLALCALAANRICLRAGLWCAWLSVSAHLYVFVGDRWAWDIPPMEQALSYLSMFAIPFIVGRRTDIARPQKLDGDDPGVPPSTPLPFTRGGNGTDSDTPRSFWAVQPTGNYIEDTHLGGEYGRIYLHHVDRLRRGPLLPWIVADMVRAGRWTGVEVGFLSAIGRSLGPAGAIGWASSYAAMGRPEYDADDHGSDGAVV